MKKSPFQYGFDPLSFSLSLPSLSLSLSLSLSVSLSETTTIQNSILLNQNDLSYLWYRNYSTNSLNYHKTLIIDTIIRTADINTLINIFIIIYRAVCE